MRPPNSPPEYVPLPDQPPENAQQAHLRSGLEQLDRLERGEAGPFYMALDGLVLVTTANASTARQRIRETWQTTYPDLFPPPRRRAAAFMLKPVRKVTALLNK